MLRSSVLLTLLFSATLLMAQAKPAPYFNVDAKGLWVEGYDPVAYFAEGKARKGLPRYSHVHQGATFHFSTQAYLDLFKRMPERYLPQYGGYCAYAMGATNEKVEVDPETFKVKDGKLFLFYNAFFNNTLTTWNKDEVRLHRAADANWKAFVHAR